jgi:two-component system cell cycle sensor histidine kinase/response regulator CckA
MVTVADTGVGIAPEILDRIFEPFFTTKPINQGTGLDLSTSLGIIKSHGGFLEVVSQIGQGTEVKLYLPEVNTEPA